MLRQGDSGSYPCITAFFIVTVAIMTDRKAPPPPDADELEPWERRELGMTDFEMSETRLRQADLEEPRDSGAAKRNLLRSLVHAQHAIYQELRALADRQYEQQQQLEHAGEVMERHSASVKKHAGALADHGSALSAHASRMNALERAITGHGDDVRDALKRL